MNKKGMNAVTGIIILVAITLIISIVVYIAIDGLVTKEKLAKEIEIEVENFSISADGELSFDLKTSSAIEKIESKATVKIKELITENRLIEKKLIRDVLNKSFNIDKGINYINVESDFILEEDRPYELYIEIETEYKTYTINKIIFQK